MGEEKVDLAQFSWFNPPEQVEMTEDGIAFTTLPDTDFWQRTHYGFRRNNGHAFMTHLWENFTFSARAEFVYEDLYDQCGLFLYIDEDNWAKASIEYEDEAFGQLGSVVTVNGYSDWAVSPIETDVNVMFYRLSRKGADFLFECSQDGDDYRQLRVFHMHGDLTKAMFGIYACSPSESSFEVRFTELAVLPSTWE